MRAQRSRHCQRPRQERCATVMTTSSPSSNRLFSCSYSIACVAAVCATVVSVSETAAASGSFPGRRPSMPIASSPVPTTAGVLSPNSVVPPNEKETSSSHSGLNAESLPDSTSSSQSSTVNEWAESVSNSVTGNGSESDDGGTSADDDDEAESSDDMEEASSNVWLLLKSSDASDVVGQTEQKQANVKVEPTTTRVDTNSGTKQHDSYIKHATGSSQPTPTKVQFTVRPKSSATATPSHPDRPHKKGPLVSQPLQTLEKLQQMLDETDYMTTSQRNLASSSPRSPDDAPERLWTSKDRMKYKRQQQRLNARSQTKPLKPLPNFSVDTDDSDEYTDDGLGYSLPDLPVYNSDAEDEDSEPMMAVANGNPHASLPLHLNSLPGGGIRDAQRTRSTGSPPPQQQLPIPQQPSPHQFTHAHNDPRYIPDMPRYQDSAIPSGSATIPDSGKQPVGGLGYGPLLPPHGPPNHHYNANSQFLSPEHQRYLMEQQLLLQQYYSHLAAQQQPYLHHLSQQQQTQQPPYAPFNVPYPVLPLPPNPQQQQQQTGYTAPLIYPPPLSQTHYSTLQSQQQSYSGAATNAQTAWPAATTTAAQQNGLRPHVSFPSKPGHPGHRESSSTASPLPPRQTPGTSGRNHFQVTPKIEPLKAASSAATSVLPKSSESPRLPKPTREAKSQQLPLIASPYPLDTVQTNFPLPYLYGHTTGLQAPALQETMMDRQVELLPSQSLAEATSRLTFDSLQKISLLLVTSGLFAYSSVSPRTLPLTEYNLKFYENIRIASLAVIAPVVYIFSVFDAHENDINSVVNSFFVSFTLGYVGTMMVEILVTTLLRLVAFCLFEPDVFALTPKVPIPLLPWVLRENQYRPKRITLFVADFATSVVACPIIEECIKLMLLQWTTKLPRNFNWVSKSSTKRKRKRRVAEAIPRPLGEQHCLNANPYVTHMLAVSLGLKLSDAGRRILLYTKPQHASKSFFAICRGIFPIHELCGAMTAVALAKRDILGMDFPLWKLLWPSVVVHAMANFRGMKPTFKWNSATPWSEMQLYPINVPDASTLLDLLKTGYAKLMWAIVLGKVFGSCVKNYYMVNRQAIKRTTKYAGNHAAFSAEVVTTELLKNQKK